MVVDIVFPGWMMWRHLAIAQDGPGYFEHVEKIKTFDFDTLVSGHVTRTGTRADVEHYLEVADQLSGEALTPADTIRFIDQVARET